MGVTLSQIYGFLPRYYVTATAADGTVVPLFDIVVPVLSGQQSSGTVLSVCVFLASGYRWVTVMHEIPISSAHPLTSLPYPRTW
jgi:hypothetical protein